MKNKESSNKNNNIELTCVESMAEAADRLKCLAHPQRLRMIELLFHGEFTVGEIAKFCEIEQSVTSVHLKLMQSKRFLKSERRNRFVYYSLADIELAGFFEFIKILYSERRDVYCEKCGT